MRSKTSQDLAGRVPDRLVGKGSGKIPRDASHQLKKTRLNQKTSGRPTARPTRPPEPPRRPGRPAGTGLGRSSRFVLAKPFFVFRGIPKWFLGQVIFGRPGISRPKNRTCSRNDWLFGLAAFGGKAKKPRCSLKCAVFWPWHPRPPKKHPRPLVFGREGGYLRQTGSGPGPGPGPDWYYKALARSVRLQSLLPLGRGN